MTYATPIGVSDLLPSDAGALDVLVDRIQSVFKTHAFLPIRTPTIEYADSLEPGLGATLKRQCIQFFDPSGERLMLRPDHTTPIARMVASRMQDEPLPLKLSYIDPVFRKSDLAKHSDTEIFQAGCEWIGDDSVGAVSELIALCLETLTQCGMSELGVEIGHVAFSDGLSDADKKALLARDYISLGHIPKRGKKEVAAEHDACAAVFDALGKYGYSDAVYVNQGLVEGIYYYTGIIFEVYSKKSREIVASGGQYNQLLRTFGYDQPAVGFAIDLNRLRGGVSHV